jgi:hypothetical protein
MDGRRFDDMARALATPATRRSALRSLAAGAATLRGRGFDRAAAACVPMGAKCGRKDQCCESGKCVSNRCHCHPPCRDGDVCRRNNTCCPKSNVCRDPDNERKGTCCGPTQTCVKGACCEREQACHNPNSGDICCPDTKLCFDGKVCCEPCGGDCCAEQGVGYVCCKNTCQPPCPEGKTLNPETCTCDCAAGARAADAGATLCCPDGQEACGGQCITACDASLCETCDAATGSCTSTCGSGTCQTCANGTCVSACANGYTCCGGVNPGDPKACVCQGGQQCLANGRGGEVCCPFSPTGDVIGCGSGCCATSVGCADPVTSLCN